MRRDDFTYELPEDLIADYPPDQRGNSRLLCLERSCDRITDHHFSDLLDYLRPGDVLVFNDTRVLPARLYGNKESGGKVEILVERLLAENKFIAQLKFSKKPKPGSLIKLEDNTHIIVTGETDGMFQLELSSEGTVMDVLNKLGHMPLPPYINRPDRGSDRERYQTVYAKNTGAVAAPTAGLHFTNELIEKISDFGVQKVFVTLHVGAGTFQPVRTEQIEQHKMHSEYLEVSAECCDVINRARNQGMRIIAVGTTSVRCLETAGKNGTLEPYSGETDIFIYPGYTFNMVDALITNFHLPESTLLMLVCAFGGNRAVLRAYNHAIRQRYRFYSYGDAMLIV